MQLKDLELSHAESVREEVEQAENRMMSDMAFLKIQHQQTLEQLKHVYQAEV